VDLGGAVTFEKALRLKSEIFERYSCGEVDEVKFVYNEFKNALSQLPVVEGFLPIEETPWVKEINEEDTQDISNYIIKPNIKDVISSLLKKHFSIQAYRILLENQASEHGSRMSAMDNASRNAEKMIKALTLQFNKERQAGITKELLEIIGGTESQKNN